MPAWEDFLETRLASGSIRGQSRRRVGKCMVDHGACASLLLFVTRSLAPPAPSPASSRELSGTDDGFGEEAVVSFSDAFLFRTCCLPWWACSV